MGVITHNIHILFSGDVAVYLDNRRVGTIISIRDGHAYVPVGQKRSTHGKTFSTIAGVLRSLEEGRLMHSLCKCGQTCLLGSSKCHDCQHEAMFKTQDKNMTDDPIKDYDRGWTAELIHCSSDHQPLTLAVDLLYPRAEGHPRYVEVGIEEVRAADSIRISYDFNRDGYVIEQASTFEWDGDDPVCDPDWQEVAFIQAWGREKESSI